MDGPISLFMPYQSGSFLRHKSCISWTYPKLLPPHYSVKHSSLSALPPACLFSIGSLCDLHARIQPRGTTCVVVLFVHCPPSFPFHKSLSPIILLEFCQRTHLNASYTDQCSMIFIFHDCQCAIMSHCLLLSDQCHLNAVSL